MLTEIISREAARVAGLPRYYTGVPCSNSHDAERYVASGNCCECTRLHASNRHVKMTVPIHFADFISAMLRKCAQVPPHMLSRCQTDPSHKLWVDGLYVGQWDDRDGVVLAMWDWYMNPEDMNFSKR